LILITLFSWVAIKQVYTGEKCTGRVYEGHMALQAECLHQQTVNQESEYPEPYVEEGEPIPYPAPMNTPMPVPTRTMPTEPPPPE
jgi:hypothetical protein